MHTGKMLLLGVFATAGCRSSPADVAAMAPAELGTGRHAGPLPVVTPLRSDHFLADAGFGKPGRLALQGHTLWLSDGEGQPFFHVIDLAAGRVRTSFGRRGRAPGEFENIGVLATRPGDSTAVWAWDAPLSRLTRIPARRDTLPLASLAFPDRYLRVTWLTADRLLLVANSDTTRFRIADARGSILSTREGPLLGRPEMPRSLRLTRTTAFALCTAPAGGGFALFYIDAGRGELYDTTGMLRRRIAVPLPSEGDFTRDSAGVWHNDGGRYYYRACASGPDRLYALYSGRSPADAPGGAHTRGDMVHVFGWDGMLRAIFRLEHDAEQILVAGDSLLYTTTTASAGIVRYRLPAARPSVAAR